MQDGKKISSTRKGDREIISVSIPLELYYKMEELCAHFNINRSAMISTAIRNYLYEMSLRVGD